MALKIAVHEITFFSAFSEFSVSELVSLRQGQKKRSMGGFQMLGWHEEKIGFGGDMGFGLLMIRSWGSLNDYNL